MNINIYPICKEFEDLLKLYPPVKASEYLPDWYKKQKNFNRLDIKFGPSVGGAKICPAIKYDVTKGIILPAWSDVILKYNKDTSEWFCAVGAINYKEEFATTFKWLSHHNPKQTDYMDLNVGIYGALKLNSPYYFATDNGVHIQFTDVFHHIRRDVRFISGTVETDIWHEVNFPFEFLNPPTDKEERILIKAGEPLLMLTPIEATKEKPSVTINNYSEEFNKAFRTNEIKHRSQTLSWHKYKQYRKGIDEEE